MNLERHRASAQEQSRIADLFTLVPAAGERALDIGSRDGYLSKRLADRFASVIALDLECPAIIHPKITLVQGDVTRLAFPDRHFDVVLCAEVLEHIPPTLLPAACGEVARVAAKVVVIGVPYRQDLRCGRTTCQTCGRPNPPWGHINSFDEGSLRELFRSLDLTRISLVGSTRARTNPISTALLDFAGNPFGTYEQKEPCVHCGAAIGNPRARTLIQRMATRTATLLNRQQAAFTRPHDNWIHVLFNAAGKSAD